MTRVLVAIDGSEQGEEALNYAREEFAGDVLVLLHVINPARAGYGAQAGIPTASEEWLEDREAEAETLFEDARDRVGDAATVETAVEVGQPARTIVEYADDEDNGIDHIVMGSHGREGITRILLGSVAETVVRRAPCPVTVVR